MVLDFDADRSVVKAGNSGKYILKPTIKVIQNEDKVDVNGTVTYDAATPAPLPGVQVSAQISDGLSATVVRSTISSGGTNDEDSLDDGEYLLTLLSPDQLYNIVAYSEGKYPACAAFKYNKDSALLPLDLTLSTADTAAVSGTVRVEGEVPLDFPLIVTIYTILECNNPENENYVELVKAVIQPPGSNSPDPNVFGYKIDLPKYEYPVTYYIVASADGYLPATAPVDVQPTDSEVTIADPLHIGPQ